MSRQGYEDYFLQPEEETHRRYEALRCVFVEGQPMKEVAERFGVSYGTVRNWASKFRQMRNAGKRPPLLRGG
jgi:transposase